MLNVVGVNDIFFSGVINKKKAKEENIMPITTTFIQLIYMYLNIEELKDNYLSYKKVLH